MVTITKLSILCAVPTRVSAGVETYREGKEQVYGAVLCLSGCKHLQQRIHLADIWMKSLLQNINSGIDFANLRASSSLPRKYIPGEGGSRRRAAHHDAVFRSAEREEEDGNWVVKAAGRGAQDLSPLLLLLRGGQDKIFAGHKKVRRWAGVWPRARGQLRPLSYDARTTTLWPQCHTKDTIKGCHGG